MDIDISTCNTIIVSVILAIAILGSLFMAFKEKRIPKTNDDKVVQFEIIKRIHIGMLRGDMEILLLPDIEIKKEVKEKLRMMGFYLEERRCEGGEGVPFEKGKNILIIKWEYALHNDVLERYYPRTK